MEFMEQLFWATILELVLVVLLLAILFVAGKVFAQRSVGMFTKQCTSTPVKARAIILHVEQTGQYFHQQAQVKLQMHVFPEKGKHFITECKQIFSFNDLAVIQNGITVMVQYNPSNPKDIMLLTAA